MGYETMSKSPDLGQLVRCGTLLVALSAMARPAAGQSRLSAPTRGLFPQVRSSPSITAGRSVAPAGALPSSQVLRSSSARTAGLSSRYHYRQSPLDVQRFTTPAYSIVDHPAYRYGSHRPHPAYRPWFYWPSYFYRPYAYGYSSYPYHYPYSYTYLYPFIAGSLGYPHGSPYGTHLSALGSYAALRAASGEPGSSSGPLRDLDLRAEPAELRLAVEPGDAAVYLDGRFLGTAGALARLEAALLIDPGTHLLEVVRPGYATLERSFEVEAGEQREIALALEPEP